MELTITDSTAVRMIDTAIGTAWDVTLRLALVVIVQVLVLVVIVQVLVHVLLRMCVSEEGIIMQSAIVEEVDVIDVMVDVICCTDDVCILSRVAPLGMSIPKSKH